MGTRRLIAIRHADGYDCVHLAMDGDNVPAFLDANWSTESAAREIIQQGDLLHIDDNGLHPTSIGGRSAHSAIDFEDLIGSMLASEHLVSIYDPTHSVENEVENWNDQASSGWQMFQMSIDNPDSSGSWIHLRDNEALQLDDDIAQDNDELLKAA